MALVFDSDSAGTMTIRDGQGGKVLWSGLPAGRRVMSLAPSRDGRRCVVLGQWDGQVKNDRNLFCVDAAGTTIWIAETPDRSGPDAYVSLRVVDGRVVANSWSCYRVVLDDSTGEILETVFTK
jgi:outer membrane protein assembly factor BamB